MAYSDSIKPSNYVYYSSTVRFNKTDAGEAKGDRREKTGIDNAEKGHPERRAKPYGFIDKLPRKTHSFSRRCAVVKRQNSAQCDGSFDRFSGVHQSLIRDRNERM